MTVTMTTMLKRLHFTIGPLLISSIMVLGAMAGCGSSGSPDQKTEPGSGDQAGTANANDRPAPNVQKPDAKATPGHNPASAYDKRGRAPDDVISDRPGGPKPPGAPQPVR